MHSGHKNENGQFITGKQHEYQQRKSSPSASPTSSAVKGSDSKSPLKIPRGVIVRTPSGRDCQGRKTPPRFFAITNEQLQQMHSSENSESIGPTHFKFQDTNQTADEAKECVCTSSLRRTETNTTKSPKDIKGRPEKIGGMITLTHLLEAEIHRSDMTKTSKVGTQIERERKGNHLSSPSASPRAECSRQVDPCMLSHKETISPSPLLSGERKVPTSVNHDAENAAKSTSPPDPSTSVISTTELFPRKVIPNPLQPTDQQSFQGNSDGSILDPSSKSECRLVTPNNRVPKGSLLHMLLSSTESADDHQICRPSLKEHNIVRTTRTTSGIQDQKSVMDQANTKLPNSPSSRGIVTSKCLTNELKETKDFTTKAGFCGRSSHTSEIVKASNSRPTQMSTSWPEVHTSEYSPTLASKGVEASAVVSDKAELTVSAQTSQILNSNNSEIIPLTSIKSKAHNVSCTLQATNPPLLTQSQKAVEIQGFSVSSVKALDDSAGIPEVPFTDHASKCSGNLSEGVKRKDDNSQNTSQVMNNGTPSHEQKDKCPRKTTLIINPVKTTSASVGSCSAGPSGQLYGLLRSPNNATGNVMLVPLGSGPQRRKGSTTLTGSGNDVGAVKPQASAPVMINNMALTGNINTDAFNVWKSYVRQAYHDKYGTNCEYYMQNRWASMSVAEKSPFVHQVQNSLRPPVVVQTSSSNPSKTSQEVIDIKAPTSKNSKAEIQRQIDIIPRLQTTGPDRPVADDPVSLSEQDIMRELYRSTKMANISPDFPMASNNSTFRKMMKSSSDFLTDPASSFDPVFAHSILSGRRHDIDNWMAMKTNWQVTPEWIVDFRAACDERKRARRAAIDAGVMRRVAMVQRMAGMTEDDDDDEAGSSTSTVQTPQKQSGKKCQQFGDSKENTPVCQEKSRQSVPIGGLSPKVGTSFDKKGDRCLTPAEVPTATRTLTKGLEVVKPVSQDQLTPECGLSSPYNERHSSSCEFKIESQPQVIAAMTSKESHRTACPSITLPTSMTIKDEGLPDALPIKNAESYSTVSQKEGCHSQDENLIGDLDLIDDKHLWNIQCSLFPPWQRVSSFIDADAADDFFKDLVRDSLGVPVAPPPPSISHNLQMENGAEVERAKNKAFLPDNHDVDCNVLGHVNKTVQDSHCRGGEAGSITSAEENIPSTSSTIPHTAKGCKIAMDLPHVNRRLFSDIPIKNECQPGDCEPTEPTAPRRVHIPKTAETHGVLNIQEWLDDCIESTSEHVSFKEIQTADPMSREEEEDAAVSKLLEILDETHPTTLPENFETVSYQNITPEHGWTAEEKVITGGFSRITAYDVQGSPGERSSQMVDEIGKWHEEIKPINAIDVTSLTSSVPLIENPRLKLSPVKDNLNEVVRDDDNDYSFSKSDEPSRQKEILIDHVEGVTHGMPVDAGSPEHSVSVSQIFRTKAEAEDNSGKIERWHEEIKPIIALAVISSSSSSSVENEIRRTDPTNNPRTTPVAELQEEDTKSDDVTEDQKDDGKADTKEQAKTTSSSSGEYVTADETDPHARGFDDRRTPDLCPTIKMEPCEEASQTSMTDESSSPLVSADGPTTFREYAEGDVSDEGMDKAVLSEEEKSHVSARKYHGRIRKKRRQDVVPDNKNAHEASPAVAQPSSDTSLTSVSSSSTSSSRITTSRKSRGRKRRRRDQRRRNKCDRKAPRDGRSPQESRESVVAKEKTHLNQDADRNDSEGDAPNESNFKRVPRQSLDTISTKLLRDQEDGPSRPHDAGHADHADENQSDDDSQGDQSPTSLKIVKRRSSRLKVKRVSKLPRLRSKRNASGTFQRNASRTLVHAKVKKTQKRKRKVK